MELSPFAQMPATPEPIIAQVRQQLAAAYPARTRLADPALTALAERTVRALWPSRVRTFVPILALRDAQEELAAQDTARQSPTARSAPTASAGEQPRRRDVLRLNDDVMSLDPDDRMRP